MARNVTVGGDGELFVGEDKVFDCEILDDDDVPVNMAGWTTAMVVRRTLTGAALLTLAGTIVGTYSATRSANTQRIRFTLLDTDWTAGHGRFHYSVKRTDDGSETVVLWGAYQTQIATQT